MATSILFEERLEIPFFASLDEFRAWARSDDFPETGRIDYIGGRIEVDMSPEDLFTHGTLKTRLISALDQLVEQADLGELPSDRTLVSCPDADVSSEPDIVFVFHASLETGRVRLVPKASGEDDRFVELEGPPDLIVEIVSDSSVKKDTQRLPEAYWRAGVREFWLADARGEEFFFRIHRPGPAGYEPALVDSEGFQRSAVLKHWFRVTRYRHRTGRWAYRVEKKPE